MTDYKSSMSQQGLLYHHGIKGQKWGVRRFQNVDGALTALGQKRYNKQLKKASNWKEKRLLDLKNSRDTAKAETNVNRRERDFHANKGHKIRRYFRDVDYQNSSKKLAEAENEIKTLEKQRGQDLINTYKTYKTQRRVEIASEVCYAALVSMKHND